eukprot:5876948-Prymnesium_polylepis.1
MRILLQLAIEAGGGLTADSTCVARAPLVAKVSGQACTTALHTRLTGRGTESPRPTSLRNGRARRARVAQRAGLAAVQRGKIGGIGKLAGRTFNGERRGARALRSRDANVIFQPAPRKAEEEDSAA